MTEMFVDPIRQPYFSPVFIPTLPDLSLSESERATISKLQMRGWRDRYRLELTDSYYRGMQVITNLNIAIPPELTSLRTIVGWPKIAVDPFVERLSCEGFRLHGATDTDQDLEDLWLANGMDAEQSLVYTDALVMGRGWTTVGSPQNPGDAPIISVESPLNMTVAWDVRSQLPKEALQSYWLDGRRHAVLFLLGQTIYLGEDDDGVWQLTNRDKHGFPFIPIQRMANQPRTHQRDGVSEISPELMSITDAACRRILGLEVASEFYSVPQKLILGATESDFVDGAGVQKSAWSTYISRILALERDEDGNVPEVKQFTPYDPSVFTKVVEMYASQAAGIMGANPQDLGLYTQGNPVSADAYNVTEARRDRRAVMKQRLFGVPLVRTMQMAMRFQNRGALPADFERMACDWMSPQLVNFVAMADGLTKLSGAGAIPASSDVTLKRAGFSAVERAQLEQDRKLDLGAQELAELASSLQAKQARADVTVATDIGSGSKITPTVAPGQPV